MMNEVKGWKLQIQLSSQSNQEIHHKRTRLLETTANDSLKKISLLNSNSDKWLNFTATARKSLSSELD